MKLNSGCVTQQGQETESLGLSYSIYKMGIRQETENLEGLSFLALRFENLFASSEEHF